MSVKEGSMMPAKPVYTGACREVNLNIPISSPVLNPVKSSPRFSLSDCICNVQPGRLNYSPMSPFLALDETQQNRANAVKPRHTSRA